MSGDEISPICELRMKHEPCDPHPINLNSLPQNLRKLQNFTKLQKTQNEIFRMAQQGLQIFQKLKKSQICLECLEFMK